MKNLTDLTKAELLDMIDVLHEWGCIDPEGLPEFREEVTKDAEDFWLKCLKYRIPLVNFVYRNLK